MSATLPKFTCRKPDCTVAATGKCLELHKILEECSFLIKDRSENGAELSTAAQPSVGPTLAEDVDEDVQAEPVDSTPQFIRRFHTGSELGVKDAVDVMRGQYAHLVGILGMTDAGKTAFLSALYLLASQGGLKPDYRFAGSLTLQGFEDRARRLRKWEKGRLPDRITDHTQLLDQRNPAFMHIALQESQGSQRRLELLLTDLPGEWTSDLINSIEKITRFDFLRRADGVIFVIDGPLMADELTRHIELHKAKMLLARLAENPLIERDVPLILMVSKCDLLDMNAPPFIAEVEEEAASLGFKVSVLLTSSFSSKPNEVKSGTGVLEAIKLIVDYAGPQTPYTSQSASELSAKRAFGRFRL